MCRNGHVCPENFNPADFYIHTLAIIPGNEEKSKEQVMAICNAFEKSELGEAVKSEIKQIENKESSQELDGLGHQEEATMLHSSLNFGMYYGELGWLI
jgi:hypothetical protein